MALRPLPFSVAAAAAPLDDGPTRRVLVLRGVPGAGKSTVARAIAAHVRVGGERAVAVSADRFFTGADGTYRFDPARLPEAHATCLRSFVDLLTTHPGGVVIVDNTATTLAEAAPYMALAAAYGWGAAIVDVSADPFRAAERNVHDVPAEAVHAAHARLVAAQASTPPWWDVARVTAGDVACLAAAEAADPAVFDV
jgi:predicted kinase